MAMGPTETRVPEGRWTDTGQLCLRSPHKPGFVFMTGTGQGLHCHPRRDPKNAVVVGELWACSTTGGAQPSPPGGFCRWKDRPWRSLSPDPLCAGGHASCPHRVPLWLPTTLLRTQGLPPRHALFLPLSDPSTHEQIFYLKPRLHKTACSPAAPAPTSPPCPVPTASSVDSHWNLLQPLLP